MLSADTGVFLWLNGFVGRWPLLDRIAGGVVNDFLVPVALTLVLFGLWFWGRNASEGERLRRGVLTAVIGLLVANAVVALLNQLYFRPRPFAENEVKLLFYKPTDSSFPSNSVAVAFSLAWGIWLAHRAMGALSLAAASLLAFARVFAGVHYPLDVLGGALIGILSVQSTSRLLPFTEPLPTLLLRLARRIYLA